MAIQVLSPNNQMGASGAGHSPGFVPDPGPTAGTTRFLREDATFAVPPAPANAADVTIANTFSQPQTFSSGIQIGAPSAGAALKYLANTFFIQFSNGTISSLFGMQPVGTNPNAGIGFQSTTPEISFSLTTQVSGTGYTAATVVESNTSNFLNAGNTIEYQVGVLKGTLTTTYPPTILAIGDNVVASSKPIVAPSIAPANGASGTIPLAKLTTGGANGSMTVVNGIITAITDPS